MRQYKGYYLDGAILTSKQDIDNFLEKQAVNAYKQACRLFNRRCDMESSIYANEKAEILVKKFGYTWEQIEAIEVEILKAS